MDITKPKPMMCSKTSSTQGLPATNIDDVLASKDTTNGESSVTPFFGCFKTHPAQLLAEYTRFATPCYNGPFSFSKPKDNHQTLQSPPEYLDCYSSFRSQDLNEQPISVF